MISPPRPRARTTCQLMQPAFTGRRTLEMQPAFREIQPAFFETQPSFLEMQPAASVGSLAELAATQRFQR